MYLQVGIDVGPGGSRTWVRNQETGRFVRTEGTPWAAWDAACFLPHVEAHTLPVVGAGGMFRTTDSKGGYSYDPRDAATIPIDEATPEHVYTARLAARRFIYSHTHPGDGTEVLHMADDEFFEHDAGQYETDLVALTNEAEPDEAPAEAGATPETPVETPEAPTETPAVDDGVEVHWTAREAAREALTDSDRQAFDNFTDLAESAEPESAREFWNAKADEIIAQGKWVQC